MSTEHSFFGLLIQFFERVKVYFNILERWLKFQFSIFIHYNLTGAIHFLLTLYIVCSYAGLYVKNRATLYFTTHYGKSGSENGLVPTRIEPT